MEIKECIKGRRSVRKYAYEKIEREVIEELIKAGQYAPSWKNSQTPRYYAAISEGAISAVNSCLPDFNAERTMGVGAYIVTTAKKGLSGCNRDGEYFSHLGNGYECFDNGLAVENIVLYAHSIGYSTLIMGLFDEGALRQLLSIPDDEDIVVVLAVGRRDIEPQRPERKSTEEILKIF